MNEPDLSDKEREQHEQAWKDLDEKVILVQILTELQQIRMTLTDATDDAQRDKNTEPTYRCRKCQATVEPSDRERHALNAHKCPADMVAGMFVEVE